tara:strand:- start:146 stop:580 length:435 start_codon:yes stop_codon:yes gene_type:complete
MRTVWKGYFSYLSFPEALEDIYKVNFIMTLDFSNASFKGETIDEESRGLFENPITVSGFVDGDFISFIVQYPHNYFFDEELGRYVVDYQNPYPGCEYSGEYIAETGKYSGTWMLLADEKREGKFQNDFIQEHLVGYWEMSQVQE